MKFIMGYSRYGIELNANKEATKDELISAYLQQYGGPQGALDHFLKHVYFIEDTIKDAEIIENNGPRSSSENPTN